MPTIHLNGETDQLHQLLTEVEDLTDFLQSLLNQVLLAQVTK